MKTKSWMWIVLALICIAPALAMPELQISGYAGGLNIVYPKIDAVPTNTNITLYFHVYNSAGRRMEGNEVNCTMFVYNTSNGVRMAKGGLIPITEEYTINLGTTRITGAIPYTVDCQCVNVSEQEPAVCDENGWVSFVLYSTDDGLMKSEEPNAFLWALILLPILLGVFFLIGAATLGDDHPVFKLFLFVLSFPMFFVSLNFALVSLIRFYDFTAMERLIGTTTWWIGIIFGVILVYFIVYAFVKIIETINLKKQEKREY